MNLGEVTNIPSEKPQELTFQKLQQAIDILRQNSQDERELEEELKRRGIIIFKSIIKRLRAKGVYISPELEKHMENYSWELLR